MYNRLWDSVHFPESRQFLFEQTFRVVHLQQWAVSHGLKQTGLSVFCHLNGAKEPVFA